MGQRSSRNSRQAAVAAAGLAIALWPGWVAQAQVQAQRAQAAAVLRGRVTLEGRRGPLPGAAVLAYRLERTALNAGPVLQGRTYAAVDGSYRIEGLKGGQYLVCVQSPGSDLLGTCDWKAPAPVLVPDGATVSGVDREVEFGRRVEVEVDDPGETLDKNETKAKSAHLLVGVWGPDKLFRPARIATMGRTTKKRTYEIVVPFDTDLGLEVRGRKLNVDDAQGRAKRDEDLPEKFRVAKDNSRAVRKVAVKVTGAKP